MIEILFLPAYLRLELTVIFLSSGYFPIKIEALPEGTCVHAHVPLYQVCAYLVLCTFWPRL